MNKIVKFVRNNKIILTTILLLIIVFSLFSCKGSKYSKENFKDNFTIPNADEKIAKIIQNTKDHSKDNLIKLSHELCANMGSTKSLSTSCLPLRDENDENEMVFIISVCCSTCYCQILKPKKEGGKYNYKYDDNTKLYYLMKENKVTQIIDGFKDRKTCVEKAKNDKLYFPYLPFEKIINQICKKD